MTSDPQHAAAIRRPHEQRVIQERADLDARLAALGLFLQSAMFHQLPADERDRLQRQAHVMAQYSTILSDRIAHFPA